MQPKDGAKIKVCLAITKGIWGGAQEYVYTLATLLPKHIYDVSVICGEGNTLQEKLISEGIRVHTIDTLKRNILFIQDIKSYIALKNIIEKEKPDILHLNSSKIGFMGGIVGKYLAVPKIIFTVHGWAFNEERFLPLSRKIFYLVQWITVMLSHSTIAVSEKTKKDADSMPYISGKIKVVHNGLKVFEMLNKLEARKEIQDMARLSENVEIIIGTVSELHRNKGLDLLIDSCRNLPFNTSVYIIGDGEEKKHLQELIDGYNLEHKIFLIGRLENARKYLKAFDIFTLSSRTEALPYSLLEAGLAGCAVVATKVGGIPEIIEDGKNGILVQRNISELEKTLIDLAEDSNKRVSLGTSLRRTVLEKFSVEKMLNETLEIYNS